MNLEKSNQVSDQPNIKLADDTIDKDDLIALSDWIKGSNRLTKSILTNEFEEAFCSAVGSKYAVYVNSGSSANMLLLYALKELGRLSSNTIIAPAVSWVTTVAPAIQLGLETRLCDCNTTNLGLDLNHLEDLIKKNKPDAVIAVHVLGHANDMIELQNLCNKYGVLVVEDACEALGTQAYGKFLGTFGVGGTFSLYYGHQLSTIEGGVIVTDDYDLYNTMLSIRAHGWARDIDAELRKKWEKEFNIDEFRSLYSFYYPGFNFRPTDLGAFLGLRQLKKIDSMISSRQDNYYRYRESLSDEFWIQQSQHDSIASFAFGTFVKNRLTTYKELRAKGVESRPLVCGNIGRQPFWVKKYGEAVLKNADIVHTNGLYLPNHQNLKQNEINYVATIMNEIAEPMNI